ncbi:DUF4019 domain-containing protein [Endozoicomonadaceae bacterium StTr2]
MRTILTALIFWGASLAHASSEQVRAEAWLQLIDNGAYQESWEQSARYFQQQVASDDWSAMIRQARALMGLVETRTLVSSENHTRFPGAPEGDYLVFVYNTAFQNKADAVETVAFVKNDGDWKAVGYYIR